MAFLHHNLFYIQEIFTRFVFMIMGFYIISWHPSSIWDSEVIFWIWVDIYLCWFTLGLEFVFPPSSNSPMAFFLFSNITTMLKIFLRTSIVLDIHNVFLHFMLYYLFGFVLLVTNKYYYTFGREFMTCVYELTRILYYCIHYTLMYSLLFPINN